VVESVFVEKAQTQKDFLKVAEVRLELVMASCIGEHTSTAPQNQPCSSSVFKKNNKQPLHSGSCIFTLLISFSGILFIIYFNSENNSVCALFNYSSVPMCSTGRCAGASYFS